VTIAAGVLTGDDSVLDEGEQALARWARQLARDPNGTTPEDVQALRDAGFDDAAILALTHYVALRLAFSTVNDALGAKPDHALADDVAPEVRAAVTWGRPAG
jgi:alkylhydroperoxidase family enzyme